MMMGTGVFHLVSEAALNRGDVDIGHS